jgi:uncharacterized membrane protein YesL
MIRRSFKRWLGKFIRVNYHGALYTISSGIILLTLVILWQKSTHTLVEPQGVLRWMLRAVFFLSIIGLS